MHSERCWLVTADWDGLALPAVPCNTTRMELVETTHGSVLLVQPTSRTVREEEPLRCL